MSAVGACPHTDRCLARTASPRAGPRDHARTPSLCLWQRAAAGASARRRATEPTLSLAASRSCISRWRFGISREGRQARPSEPAAAGCNGMRSVARRTSMKNDETHSVRAWPNAFSPIVPPHSCSSQSLPDVRGNDARSLNDAFSPLRSPASTPSTNNCKYRRATGLMLYLRRGVTPS